MSRVTQCGLSEPLKELLSKLEGKYYGCCYHLNQESLQSSEHALGIDFLKGLDNQLHDEFIQEILNRRTV